MNPELVVLIGPPGAGKSTVGKVLARINSLVFLDTDDLIENKVGKKIAEIFIEDGELFFRQIEEELVLETLDQADGVLALGGGAVLSAKVREKLESFLNVVFLDVSISNAAPRVGFNKERPLLMINPRQQWQELMNERRPIYEQVSKYIVDTNNKKPREVALEICRALGITNALN
jgi:shikimate kinase